MAGKNRSNRKNRGRSKLVTTFEYMALLTIEATLAEFDSSLKVKS